MQRIFTIRTCIYSIIIFFCFWIFKFVITMSKTYVTQSQEKDLGICRKRNPLSLCTQSSPASPQLLLRERGKTGFVFPHRWLMWAKWRKSRKWSYMAQGRKQLSRRFLQVLFTHIRRTRILQRTKDIHQKWRRHRYWKNRRS